jgi:adenine-specific DNA methylase
VIPAQCKKLIEVDLPIKAVSVNALHEQKVKRGHLHSMHTWWATRPLAACRAVLLGALLPDPADSNCPEDFKRRTWELLRPLSTEMVGDGTTIRQALLQFVAEFSTWENSNDRMMVNTARELVKIAYSDGPPLVVDPFAGIGSIPFEALRLGTETFAEDLNPVATLLLKTVLEYTPQYGRRLAEALEHWGAWVEERAKSELQPFYPFDRDGQIPFAYLWTRKIHCEGPSCGVEVPLLGMLRLSKNVALRYRGDKKNKRISFEIFEPNSNTEIQNPIASRFTATCPVCGYTTPYTRVVEQLRKQRGGTEDAKMIAVITIKSNGEIGCRLATERDLEAANRAAQRLQELGRKDKHPRPIVPREPLPPKGTLGFRVQKYGMKNWGDLFSPRQTLALISFGRIIREAHIEILKNTGDENFSRAVTACLALAASNMSQNLSSQSQWLYSFETVRSGLFGNALPMRPDFIELNLSVRGTRGFNYFLERIIRVIEREEVISVRGATVLQGSATKIPLPDQSVHIVATDPPYYNAIPYAALSDFFYVWLKRMLGELYIDLFQWDVTPKEEECIVDPGNPLKDSVFFENTMRTALAECRRILRPDGIAVVLFAHKSTAGWEALLKALVEAGWMVTASWPIITEDPRRMRAQNSAVLASSVFLVCRPRPHNAGAGDWREVLSELQPRVHMWLERLVKEGIIGADAIFACLGPALEIYSRYNNVETAGGKRIELADKYEKKSGLIDRGYLSFVWESVAKEALNMIFEGADPSGFEQDSRLTAMWLWTLRTETRGINEKDVDESLEERVTRKAKGYLLEYDAVRKIAQGLGAHLEELSRQGGIVEIKGKIATLLFATERREALFGQAKSKIDKTPRGQMTLLGTSVSETKTIDSVPETGRTILDRLHQAMLLFADGKSEALRRFLVVEGVGKDDRFWRLAQALSALYPRKSDEKRWVDGVLARKKSLGF